MQEILHVAFEYKKGVGGLKSVINGLLPSLAAKNKYNISIVTPYFKFFTADDLKNISLIGNIKHIHQKQICTSDVYLCIDSTENGTVKHYLIKPEAGSPVGMIFDIDDEKNIYQGYEHSEPLYRLSYFNGAIASLVRLAQDHNIPEFHIVHTHAWHTALGACLIKEYESLSLVEEIRAVTSCTSLKKIPYVVNTIHILSENECGLLHDDHLDLLFRSVGLPINFEYKFKQFSQHINAKATKQLVLGLLYCDQVTIVSRGLAKDVLNGRGCGIDDIFKKLKTEDRLLGINNGIIFERWDATSCKILSGKFLKLDKPLEGKLYLKRELIKTFTELSADKKWFLFVGRFSEEKGVDMLQHALKAIQQIKANFIIMGIYTVVGNGFGANVIKQMISSFKNRENVLLIDSEQTQNDFGMQIRAASDFTVVPSHIEACGLVPMEAMACGSIPITSNVQGLPDCVLQLNENIATGTGFIYSDDAKTRNEGIKNAIILANDIYNDLLAKSEIDRLLSRILEHSKNFDWKQSVADNYISLYKKISSQQLLQPSYESIQSHGPPKPSATLYEFLSKYSFDLGNFNMVNEHGSTPLTVAISQNMLDIAKELIILGANPIVANCHGNTPMYFIDNKPELFSGSPFINILSNAIKFFTIPELREENNQIIEIRDRWYKVEKIIKNGSCSISVLVLTCQLSKKQYILKINSRIGGLEIRNHILLDLFTDLLSIGIFIQDDSNTRSNVQGLLQPLVPGVNLDDYFIQNISNQEEIDRVIGIAITALNKLHVDKDCVHKDALPGNALYNISTDTVTFIDLATLSTRTDRGMKDFEFKKINDFKRLLLGDEAKTKGLKDFSKNMQQIISRIVDQNIQAICNEILTSYERMQPKEPPKPSIALYEFLSKYGFDLGNFNMVNEHGSTPLTVAISQNILDIAKELIILGANPIVANCHGNTPMSLMDSKLGLFSSSSFINILSNSIKFFTIPELREKNNQIIKIRGNWYKIEKIIKDGSCSISVLVLTCQLSKKQYILKINSRLGGLEIRNHILLNLFTDLLNIDIFINNERKIRKNVQGLLQPLVPGVNLDDYFIQNINNQEEIDRVIGIAITALNKLHVDKDSVHKDALPRNALYNISTNTVTFIDLATLSMKTDRGMKDFELEKINDFKRLLLGNEAKTKGLKDFSKNIHWIIFRIEDQNIQFVCKKIFTSYESIQSHGPPKPSAALYEFLSKYSFDLGNFNMVNEHGSTPLTVAISQNMLDIAKELIILGANPIVANCHGNTPMYFIDNKPELFSGSPFINILSNAIKFFTIPELREENNQIIEIRDRWYKVEKIIKNGSCSISVLVLTCQLSKKQYILKINSRIGGLEIRNHILLDLFTDLLSIGIFIQDDSNTRSNVQGLLQPLVPGVNLDDYFIQNISNQEEIDRVIGIAITALNKLHVDKDCVHKDALPGNALYNISTDTVTFIDLATLSTRTDRGMKDFEFKKINDFKRLLLGDEAKTKGLKDFSKNMQQIISRIVDQSIRDICNRILGFPGSNNPMRILHVALEYGQAVLGGLGMVTTQMVKAQNVFINSNGDRSDVGIITPFYPKLYTESKFTKVATVKHLFGDNLEISNILFCSIHKHYMVEPAGNHVNMFNISTVHGIYNNDAHSSFINKLLYFNSAVSAYIALDATVESHPRPQIIQLHDWTVALVSELLNKIHKYNKSRILFIVHIDNLDHGAYGHDALRGIGLKFITGTHILKAIGVRNSDMIVTVSPSFLQECLKIESQNHNAEILRRLFVIANAKNKIIGIANGFTYIKYCPIGVLIADKSNIFRDKLRIKTELAKLLNGSRSVWKIDPNLPLILYIGRYSPEKGVETFKLLIDTINTQAVFMAFGRGFEKHVFDVINEYSRQMKNVYVTFSELEQKEYLPLARAGAEFMFIPSHREADGLVIKEGFANGCIAITSGIGGLIDSAVPFDCTDPNHTSGNSFIYEDSNNISLTKNVKQSLLIWSNFDQDQKSKVHLRLMDEAKNHDWSAPDGPLKKYDEVCCEMISNNHTRLMIV